MKKKRNPKVDKTTGKTYAESAFQTKFDERGRRLMICMNSVPDGKYWRGHICNEWSAVGTDTPAVLCYKCTNALLDHSGLAAKAAAAKSDKPKGWKFMKEFVATDGTVYHKGVEQPSLKGTLPVTVIEAKPEKKKLTKQEKEDAIQALGTEIEKLKVGIMRESKKGKKAELVRALAKANKTLKKLL